MFLAGKSTNRKLENKKNDRKQVEPDPNKFLRSLLFTPKKKKKSPHFKT